MKRCAKILYAFICSLLLAAASPSAGWAQPHVLVNAGGGAYKDNLGRNWLADTWFNTSIDGTRYSKNAIANTTWDYLYQTERWSPQLAYQIPLTNGSYTITLHFAEIVYGGAGRRVFSVASEGQQVISNLDIYKEAGKNKALLKTFSTQVNDGFLDLTFIAIVDNPKISAIEIAGSVLGENAPPTVNAGPDQTITLPANSVSLSGTAGDDGLPSPPAALTYSWTKTSGPGTVSFGSANALNTSASFSAAGTYVLTLTASDGLLFAADALTITVNNQPTGGAAAIRYNSGGSSYTDAAGNSWVPDAGFTNAGGGTHSTSTAIAGTASDVLYQSERWGPDLAYHIPAANGLYSVTLHFAEIYWTGPGQRVFSVSAEGTQVISNLDIFQEAGSFTALQRTFNASVTDGVLDIAFIQVIENPKVSAIEIALLSSSGNQPPIVNAGADQVIVLPANSVSLSGTASDDGQPSPPAALTYSWTKTSGPGTVSFTAPDALSTNASFSAAGAYVLTLTAHDGALSASDTVNITVNEQSPGAAAIRYNCGGSSYTDGAGNSWVPDANFSNTGGSTHSTTAGIAGTASDALYQSERWGANLAYHIPVPNGLYGVTLHFAEIYWSAAGQRVFSVGAEGVPVITGLDIAQQAGSFAALQQTFNVNVSDGFLDLAFIAVVENPKISALEIVPLAPGGNQPPTVNAGADQTIVLPANSVSLSGTASDDGLPNPPAALAYSWIKTSGPGTVSFTNPGSLITGATFSAEGAYVLTLTASDGQLSASDSMSVTVSHHVDPGTSTVRINAGGSAYTDSTGNSWAADIHFGASTDTYSTTAPIGGTADDALYQSERWGPSLAYNIPVANGSYMITLYFAEIWFTAPNSRVFSVSAEGQQTVSSLDVFGEAGANYALAKTFPVTVSDGLLNLAFEKIVENPKISAIEVVPADEAGHLLHVVMKVPGIVVDYDGNGSEVVVLDGSASHTHELNHFLVQYVWKDGNTILGQGQQIAVSLAQGIHSISLTITDDAVPAKSLTETQTVGVFAANAVGGVLAHYYPAGGTPLDGFLTSLPAAPSFAERLPEAAVHGLGGKVGGSPYAGNVAVVLYFNLQLAGGTYSLSASGGDPALIFVDGVLHTGPVLLTAGVHSIEARLGISAAASLPRTVLFAENGGSPAEIPAGALWHDETNVKPVISAITPASASSGSSVVLSGLGFLPSSAVSVYWNDAQLPASAVNIVPESISFAVPAGAGTVSAFVTTPAGTSNAVSFTYAGGGPVSFTTATAASAASPTQAVWGPDGRFYVGTVSGKILIYSFSDTYAVAGVQEVNTISALSNPSILGIAFSPYNTNGNPKLFVAHSHLFAKGGGCFTGSLEYSGQISILEGPSFSSAVPLITGLPVSNFDHAVNGLQFDNNGDLYIAVGSGTNAGVKDCGLGDAPESPFSAAILKAAITDPAFDGSINYYMSSTGQLNNDAVYGEQVDPAPGLKISVFASGLRNPFDLLYTTAGRIYSAVNGPDPSEGPASTSLTTSQPITVDLPDEFNHIVEGAYYGHPNRSRGRYFPRETLYHPATEPDIPGVYTGPMALIYESADGMDEYRAQTFGGQIRGDILVQRWNYEVHSIKLSSDGTSVVAMPVLQGGPAGLDIVCAPGGVILGTDYSGNKITVSKPVDTEAPPTVAYDIFPWRAPADGSARFIVGGKGFGSLSDTSVTIGGAAASVDYVSPTAIKGFIPATAGSTGEFLDVVVKTNGTTTAISKAFRYLP